MRVWLLGGALAVVAFTDPSAAQTNDRADTAQNGVPTVTVLNKAPEASRGRRAAYARSLAAASRRCRAVRGSCATAFGCRHACRKCNGAGQRGRNRYRRGEARRARAAAARSDARDQHRSFTPADDRLGARCDLAYVADLVGPLRPPHADWHLPADVDDEDVVLAAVRLRADAVFDLLPPGCRDPRHLLPSARWGDPRRMVACGSSRGMPQSCSGSSPSTAASGRRSSCTGGQIILKMRWPTSRRAADRQRMRPYDTAAKVPLPLSAAELLSPCRQPPAAGLLPTRRARSAATTAAPRRPRAACTRTATGSDGWLFGGLSENRFPLFRKHFGLEGFQVGLLLKRT